jgi:chromosome segregation ATPase
MKKISLFITGMLFVFSSVFAVGNANNDTAALQKQKAELEIKKQQVEQQRIQIEQQKKQVESEMKTQLEAKRVEAERVRAELETKRKEAETKKVQYKTKKEEYLAFKNVLNSKKEELKVSRDENLRILGINKDLRTSIKTEIERIKTSNITLDQSVIDNVNTKNDEVKDIISSISNTNGKITSLLNQNKDLIRNKDYVQMDLVYSQINEIQKIRNDNLIYANSILTDVLNILKDIK